MQVVGRVQEGQDVLKAIVALGTDSHDAPGETVRIARCGLATARGVPEDDDGGAADTRRQETPEQTAARLRRESAEAQNEVRFGSSCRMHALSPGLCVMALHECLASVKTRV